MRQENHFVQQDFQGKEASKAPLSAPMKRDLLHALEKNELLLFYQPQVNIHTGKIVGNEALVRWNHPKEGIISPQAFIPLLEENGLIIPIGEWVLKTACSQNKRWQDQGFEPMSISVNLSPVQFAGGNIIEVIKTVLEDTGLAPRYLNIEITESMTMDVERSITVLKELKNLGIFISIDDFGTGYSSLSYLKRFPVDTLKIDQSFVKECTADANDATIVRAIISMCHSLNLNIVAEGVETNEHVVFLQQHLCNEAQGYFFSRPLPAEEVEKKFQEISQMLNRYCVDNESDRQMQQLDSFLDHMSDAVCIMDLQTTVLRVNRSFETVFGWTSKELVGKTLLHLPEAFENEHCIYNKIVRGENITDYRTLAMHKDGSIINLNLNISPIHNRQGKVIAVTCTQAKV